MKQMLIIIGCSILGLAALIAFSLHVKSDEEYKESPAGQCEAAIEAAVASVKADRKAAVKREYENGDFTWTVFSYDDAGNCTKETETESGGTVTVTERTYDSENRLTDTKTTENEEFDEHLSYSYAEDGGYTVTTYFESGEEKLVQTYDADGDCIAYLEYGEDGSEILKRDYVFDEAGNLERTVIYYDGNLDSVEENEYYEDGKLAETISYDNEYSIEHWTEYVYNDDGLLIQKDTSDGDLKFESAETYEYDSEGRMTRKNQMADYETIGGYNIYTYDDAGKLLSSELYNKAGELTMSGTYTYDSRERKLSECWTDGTGAQTSKTVYTYHGDEPDPVSTYQYGAEDVLQSFSELIYDEKTDRVTSAKGSEKNKTYTETWYYGK